MQLLITLPLKFPTCQDIFIFLHKNLKTFKKLRIKILCFSTCKRQREEEPEEEQEFVQSFELKLLQMGLLCSVSPSEEMPETHLRSPLPVAGILSPEVVERPFSSYPSFLSLELSLLVLVFESFLQENYELFKCLILWFEYLWYWRDYLYIEKSVMFGQ